MVFPKIGSSCVMALPLDPLREVSICQGGLFGSNVHGESLV